MKKRFTEEQIISILSELKAGKSAKQLGREKGVTTQTLYSWKKKFGDMDVSEARRLKSLEQENARLKRLVADLSIDNQMHKDLTASFFSSRANTMPDEDSLADSQLATWNSKSAVIERPRKVNSFKISTCCLPFKICNITIATVNYSVK